MLGETTNSFVAHTDDLTLLMLSCSVLILLVLVLILVLCNILDLE